MRKLLRRGKRFRMYYDDCETNLLELLYNHNMTFADLSRAVDMPAGTIAMLAYGEISPVYLLGKNAGQVRRDVLRICDHFDRELADIFPRYFCNIVDKLTANSDDLIYMNWISPLGNIEQVEHNLFWRKILKNAKALYIDYGYWPTHIERDWDMFFKYIVQDMTYQEIGDIYKVTRNNVRIILNDVYSAILKTIREEMPDWSIDDFKRYLGEQS